MRLAERLKSSVMERLRPQQTGPIGSRNATVIAIAARKGGVGKTTTAVNLACALAEAGQRVFLIDLDGQAQVTTALQEIARPGGTPIAELLLAGKGDLMDAAVESALPGLFLTPADKRHQDDLEGRLASKMGREIILQQLSERARTYFDYIIIDTPPTLQTITLNALCAADYALLPCEMSLLAFEGVAELCSALETVNTRLRHPIQLMGILRTRVDGRNQTLNREFEQALRDNFGEALLDVLIPVNSALTKAQTCGVSIFQHAPRSKGAQAYRALAVEVQRRAKPVAKRAHA